MRFIPALVCLAALTLHAVFAPATASGQPGPHEWTDEETSVIRSLWIGSLPPLRADPSNAYEEDPRAVALGRDLFSDTRFSGNYKVSCATCHRLDYDLTDDLPFAHGMGTTQRRSMPLAGVAYGDWFFWDGRKDSLWSQALAPIESPVEHGISRTRCAHLIEEHYRERYEAIFGPMPDFSLDTCPDIARPSADNPEAQRAWDLIPALKRNEINTLYANMGKAIAAFVRRILPGPARFDNYAEALIKGDTEAMRALFSDEEAAGLRLFIGRARCVNCHSGPLFSNFGFHNVGVPPAEGREPDQGRAEGIALVQSEEFNCLGPHSDAAARDCSALRFIDPNTAKYGGAFKTPSLRNVADRPPYMHAGQFKSISEVLEHYASLKPGEGADASLKHEGLSAEERGLIEKFLRTLSGPIIYP